MGAMTRDDMLLPQIETLYLIPYLTRSQPRDFLPPIRLVEGKLSHISQNYPILYVVDHTA